MRCRHTWFYFTTTLGKRHRRCHACGTVQKQSKFLFLRFWTLS